MTTTQQLPTLKVSVTLTKNADGTLDMEAILAQAERDVLSEVERITSSSANMVSFLNANSTRFVTTEEIHDHLVKLVSRSEARKLRETDPDADYDMPLAYRKQLCEEASKTIEDGKGSVFEVAIGRAGGVQTLVNAAAIHAERAAKKNKAKLSSNLSYPNPNSYFKALKD